MDTLYTLAEVKALTGLSASTIYDRMSKDDFPKPVRLSPRRVKWRDRDLQRWLDARSEAA